LHPLYTSPLLPTVDTNCQELGAPRGFADVGGEALAREDETIAERLDQERALGA
jgi:hypothetical protein